MVDTITYTVKRKDGSSVLIKANWQCNKHVAVGSLIE